MSSSPSPPVTEQSSHKRAQQRQRRGYGSPDARRVTGLRLLSASRISRRIDGLLTWEAVVADMPPSLGPESPPRRFPLPPPSPRRPRLADSPFLVPFPVPCLRSGWLRVPVSRRLTLDSQSPLLLYPVPQRLPLLSPVPQLSVPVLRSASFRLVVVLWTPGFCHGLGPPSGSPPPALVHHFPGSTDCRSQIMSSDWLRGVPEEADQSLLLSHPERYEARRTSISPSQLTGPEEPCRALEIQSEEVIQTQLKTTGHSSPLTRFRDMGGRWRDGEPLSMQPFTWQPSKDGERLIGRILLSKRMHDGTVPADAASLLGLKVVLFFSSSSSSSSWCSALLIVVGGKMTESGRLCAFITKVKRGSLADTVGHLRPGGIAKEAGPMRSLLGAGPLGRGPGPGQGLDAGVMTRDQVQTQPGDQVLEWNGRVLQGATFNEVYNIILDSKAEPQVELLVSRPGSNIQLESSEFMTQHNHHKETHNHHKETHNHHKETLNHHKETHNHHKETHNHHKETHNHHKETLNHHKETHNHHKETHNHHKETHNHHKETHNHHKETLNHHKETLDHHKETLNHHKETHNHKETLDNHKETLDHHKETLEHHKETLEHHKETHNHKETLD
ncbi:Regulating synaptic membrane exocytosis protein 2 [Liparis tanakae]|uniref:Regulating synaptic membrane exocytosis protein 2 n=1 Tax=Liparis tanakae TaxID=230148 RepID=A0A4Z2GVU9_9TELE|nr:Regulating synaptic membrane exocytosis protein 2 [Liparis tanakae]